MLIHGEVETSPAKEGADCVPKLLASVRLSNDLPAKGTSYDYYSSFPAFRTLMDAQSSKLLYMMQKLINYQGVNASVLCGSVGGDVHERFESMIEVNDELLERVGAALDAHERANSGADQRQDQQQRPAPLPPPAAASATSAAAIRFLAARNVARPQAKFGLKPDNSAAPFRCRLRVKHNAQVPLTEDQLQHPYGPELTKFQPSKRFLGVTPADDGPSAGRHASPPLPPPSDLDDTELTLVQTPDDLAELLAVLEGESELAVDLEAHSYRSYLGITCLIQVSTRTQDFVIDALRLWDHVWQLNRVFTDPRILKVFHGASNDLQWLQRDFGIFLVNLFDTYMASHALSLARHSLSHLMQTYCGFTPDKQFQLADWRIRPLPTEMLRYARCDTHYLLYIADRMRADLWRRANGSAELVLRVFDDSRRLCLELYKKPALGADDNRLLLAKSRKAFNAAQMHALERLYAWRDSAARTEDESQAYVLPDHMLLAVCDLLPREFTGVLACCNPVPPLVRKYVHDIHRIVLEARELRPANADVSQQSIGADSAAAAATPESARRLPQHRCPHDVSHFAPELRADYACPSPPPSLPLQELLSTATGSVPVKSAPSISVFCRLGCAPPAATEADEERLRATLQRMVSPFYAVPPRPPAFFVVKAAPDATEDADADAEAPLSPPDADRPVKAEPVEEELPLLTPSERKQRRPRRPKAPKAVAANAEAAEEAEPEAFDYNQAAADLARQAMDRFPIRDPLNLMGRAPGGARRRGSAQPSDSRLAKFRRKQNF